MDTDIKKELWGWQILLVATGLELLSLIFNISSGISLIIMIIASIVGIVNISKKRHDKQGYYIALSIVSYIIALSIVGSIHH